MDFVLLFPGQGSQSPGMGRWLHDEFALARETFEEGSDVLNINLKKLLFEGSDADLALTENTQPALLCVSTATQRVLRAEFDLPIGAAAGHSVGEYAALVAAGVLPFGFAMRAVRARGQAMQSAVPVGQGGMIATLGLEPAQARWLCESVTKASGLGPLTPANYNSPGQIVLSGATAAIQYLRDNFKPDEIPGGPKRAKLIPLNVSAPFHCEMMAPAEAVMKEFLGGTEFAAAQFPICQNFTAELESDPDVLRDNLVRQISAPVLWTQSMEHLKNRGYSRMIECGHGQVLRGLLKKIDPETFKVVSMTSLDDLKGFGKELGA